ncbi:angiopoietin-1 receptor-like [Strongylocentrotus purpuratus]|uniref:Uncharacterized protein n=1 Tax=Strongylocentrotus purpuratus TaxID=7668 RepID=A0A7M7T450_STRPU|nr:angiopoietin-1 receptor-like [Strongylocentrotus purpuratus]
MTSRYNADVSDDVITWMKDGSHVLTSFGGQTQINFPNPIQTSDQGIYEIYYDNERNQNRGGLYRLIVRECPAVCRTDGGNQFGWNCEFECSSRGGANSCHGILFCLPDPYGCSCDVGAHGLACTTLCTASTYGPGCSQTCHCAGGGSACDIYSGICTGGCQTGWSGDNCQIPDECEAGYYGSQCTDKCHCFNDEPCEKQTGECPEQKCALGYKIRNDGVKCQECEGGTFGLDCLQQCHCAQEACETERGLCKGLCIDSWIEPSCSQRISRLVPVRVNPYQPSSFTCYVEGIPLPDASSVDLYRRTGSNNNKTGITSRSSTVSGSERAVIFDVDSVYPQEDGGYECTLTVGNTGYPSTPITNPTYVLPVIENVPVIVGTTSTTVGLRWNAWSEDDDIGDPPLVGYDVFVEKDGAWVTDQRVDQLTTSAIVSNLTPDTDSRFRVAAVREGTGGTGPVSPSNSIITRCRKPSASPTGLQVSAINPKELEVIWEHLPSESAECRSGVTNYMIYYAPSGSTSSSSILVFRDTSSYTIRGLDTYLDYIIQLTASNKDAESDRSSETIGKTLEEVAPAPIHVAIPQSTTSSFTVSWSTHLPSNINGNIQKYIIRYQQTDPVLVDGDYKSEEVLNGAFEGEHTVVDLPREINYTVQIQTINGAGSSNWSEPVNAKTILSGDDNGSRKPLSAVIGGVIVSIVLIAILLITLVMYRRIKQRRLETEPAASPPNNARETSSKYENPVFDDSKQDPNTYEDLNADTHTYQDLNTDTPNYQNLTDPHTYQDLKKPNTDVTYLEAITSDTGDTYEEI